MVEVTVTFYGRKIGAMGVSSHCCETVVVPDDWTPLVVELEVCKTHEHIFGMKIIRTKKMAEKDSTYQVRLDEKKVTMVFGRSCDCSPIDEVDTTLYNFVESGIPICNVCEEPFFLSVTVAELPKIYRETENRPRSKK